METEDVQIDIRGAASGEATHAGSSRRDRGRAPRDRSPSTASTRSVVFTSPGHAGSSGRSASRSLTRPPVIKRSPSSSSKGGGGSDRESLTGSARRLFRESAGGGKMSVGSSASGSGASPSVLQSSVHVVLKAAGEGDIATVAAFLDAGGDVNAKSKTGASTPLSRAAAKGHLNVVILLLERGAAVNIPGRGGLTPLHEAAGCGKLEVCRVLLGAGAAVAARDHSRRCPLHYAGTSTSVTQLLLDFGADPEAQDKNGQRPDAMAVNHEARALLRDARCAVREDSVGDNASRVIASLRRELENLEHESTAARESAAEEVAHREKLELELHGLRNQVTALTQELELLRKRQEAKTSQGVGEGSQQIPPATQAELRQVRAALKVARAAAAEEKKRRETLEAEFDALVEKAVAKAAAAAAVKTLKKKKSRSGIQEESGESISEGGALHHTASVSEGDGVITTSLPEEGVRMEEGGGADAKDLDTRVLAAEDPNRRHADRKAGEDQDAQARGFVERRIEEVEDQERAAIAAAAAGGTLPPAALPWRRYTAGVISPRIGSPSYVASKGFGGSISLDRPLEGNTRLTRQHGGGHGCEKTVQARGMTTPVKEKAQSLDGTRAETAGKDGLEPPPKIRTLAWAPYATNTTVDERTGGVGSTSVDPHAPSGKVMTAAPGCGDQDPEATVRDGTAVEIDARGAAASSTSTEHLPVDRSSPRREADKSKVLHVGDDGRRGGALGMADGEASSASVRQRARGDTSCARYSSFSSTSESSDVISAFAESDVDWDERDAVLTGGVADGGVWEALAAAIKVELEEMKVRVHEVDAENVRLRTEATDRSRETESDNDRECISEQPDRERGVAEADDSTVLCEAEPHRGVFARVFEAVPRVANIYWEM